MAGHVAEGLPDFDDLWDYDNPAVTERKFRELLAQTRASGNISYLAQLLTQIARTQGLQRRFEDAHRTLDEADRLLTGQDARPRIRYFLERGRVFNSSGNPGESRPLFLRAWELAKASSEDFYAVDVAHMMAIIEPPEHQLEWNFKALELAESSSDPRARRWKGSLYNNLGWNYFDAMQYEKALEIFHKALRWREEQQSLKEIRIAKWCVAKTLRMLGRVEEALEMQKVLLDEYERIREKSGYVYEELGECLLAVGRRDEARRFFSQAYNELSKDEWLVANEPDRLKRLDELGKS